MGSEPGDCVLDPFFGSGTLGVVARELGRSYLGIEINPTYVELAERRLRSREGYGFESRVLQHRLLEDTPDFES
jgi:DNA modification methylase